MSILHWKDSLINYFNNHFEWKYSIILEDKHRLKIEWHSELLFSFKKMLELCVIAIVWKTWSEEYIFTMCYKNVL